MTSRDNPDNYEVQSTVIREVGEHDDNHQEQQQQQHEKKSVLKKVKAKAKKIKNTLGIKKHDHGHEHDNGHEHEHEHDQHEHHPHREDDEDLDEEDDDEPEQVPEVHKAPMYESKAANKFVEAKNVISDQPRVHSGQMPPLEPDPHAPKDRFGTGTAAPGNDQTKVTDPTGAGGKEVDVESFSRSFGKMEVTSSNDPDSSNDQLSPDYSSTPTQAYPTPEQSQPILETKHQETNVVGEHQPTNQTSSKSSSYTEKLSTATYAIADKAISAKNAVASKLGYGAGSNDMADTNKGTGSGSGSGSGAVAYGKQVVSAVTDKLAPVYEKVAGAGSAVVSKVSGTGTGTGVGQGSDTGTGHGGVQGSDKGVTVNAYLAEKFRPGEEDKALSEVISGALHKKNEDAKRNEDEDHSKKVKEAMGRVTESEGVVKKLGTDDEIRSVSSGSDSGVVVGGGSGSGIGTVDRMRGTVASWFGSTNKGGQTDPTTESHSPSSNVGERQEDMLSQTRHEEMSHVGEERRLQESTN